MTPYEQLVHNTTNHPPVSDDVIGSFEELRYAARFFGEKIIVECPPSREASLAMTNLEQSLMWAVAAVARNQAAV